MAPPALNNRFYTGVIHIRRTGEMFAGKHEALVSQRLFNAVHDRLAGRFRSKGWRHDFLFRGLFMCGDCRRYLTGERQKGHTYYRCHTPTCRGTCHPEEALEAALLNSWPPIATADDRDDLIAEIRALLTADAASEATQGMTRVAQLGLLRDRTARLVDAFIDGAIDKKTFTERKAQLAVEQRSLEEPPSAAAQTQVEAVEDTLNELFELGSSAQRSYKLANRLDKREMVVRLSSNRTVRGKNVVVEPCLPLLLLAKRRLVPSGEDDQGAVRTLKGDARAIIEWAKRHVARPEEGSAQHRAA